MTLPCPYVMVIRNIREQKIVKIPLPLFVYMKRKYLCTNWVSQKDNTMRSPKNLERKQFSKLTSGKRRTQRASQHLC